MDLLIGCGSNRDKRITTNRNYWENLVTLDNNLEHKPDVVHDLMQIPLPFADNKFDEIHAYEVLEHTGQQGDYKFFFNQFSDFWRILKPDGLFCGSCPMPNSTWAWGDPSHTRVIQKENFVFLSQPFYKENVGATSASDFRYIYKADFDFVFMEEKDDGFRFVLRAIKPSRIDCG
jgi:SAM-dependent methyltransferase